MKSQIPHRDCEDARLGRRLERRGVLAGLAGLAVTASLFPSGAALAHHSFSMFDMDKTLVVKGKVSKFRWQMPHVWIHLNLRKPNGETYEWAGECHAPNIIARKGWNRETLRAGDDITVTMHPMRDGSAMGSVVSIRLKDGTVLWNAESKTRV